MGLAVTCQQKGHVCSVPTNVLISQPSDQNKNISCKVPLNPPAINITVLSGEYCNLDEGINCMANFSCVAGTCKPIAARVNMTCSSAKTCDVGQYCATSNMTCQPYLAWGRTCLTNGSADPTVDPCGANVCMQFLSPNVTNHTGVCVTRNSIKTGTLIANQTS